MVVETNATSVASITIPRQSRGFSQGKYPCRWSASLAEQHPDCLEQKQRPVPGSRGKRNPSCSSTVESAPDLRVLIS
jgi:hypothetical protein